MVFLTKVKYVINGMSAEAYEQYGMHPSPGSYTTGKWARKEQAIDEHNQQVVMQTWQATALRAARNASR